MSYIIALISLNSYFLFLSKKYNVEKNQTCGDSINSIIYTVVKTVLVCTWSNSLILPINTLTKGVEIKYIRQNITTIRTPKPADSKKFRTLLDIL